MGNGWFALHRNYFDHWLWKIPRKFSEAEAFLDMLGLAAYEEERRDHGRDQVDLEPGEFPMTDRELADRWKWSRGSVRRFLGLLERQEMVIRKPITKRSTI